MDSGPPILCSAAEAPSARLRGFAERGFAGKLDLYLGAGVSNGWPTGLPLGRDLFDRVRYAVMAEFPEQFDPENPPASLEDLGSAIGGDPVRETRFNRLLIEAAEFTTEEPNYAHRAVALLVLLGLSTVVSANWDDCVERAAVELRGKITPTVTANDRRKLKWHQGFHKVHGCANYEDSLLVSKEALKEPPDWVAKAVGADIGTETLVFVGLATVGDYHRGRLLSSG